MPKAERVGDLHNFKLLISSRLIKYYMNPNRISSIIVYLLFFGLFTGNKTAAQTLAFPGAEGAGKYVSGGRGTRFVGTTVFEVTNLSDNNTVGSLRYALNQPTSSYAYRTIVFKVSGTIHLTSGLDIPGNTTLAGQTAPGDGICIADHPVYIKGDNVIVRYLRFRMGDRYQNKGKVAGGGSDDALGSTGASKLIIDHCSVSWSTDEAMTVYRGDSLTLQWNLISEPLNYSYHFEEGDTDFEQHGYGGIWGAINGSFHHNLFAHCRNRTPRFAGGDTYESGKSETCDFRNNVLYNWGINNIYGGDGGHYNVVNNYYKYGPNTSNSRKYQIVNVDSVSPTVQWATYFLKGNYVDGSTANTNRNFLGVGMGNWSLKDTVKFKANVPFNLPDTIGESAFSAYNNVLAKVGCSFPKRDTLDERIINNVKNRTGKIIDVQGGFIHGTDYSISYVAWPELNSTPAPADSDHDGMPDAWEITYGLDPNNTSDRSNRNSLGYTNLEVYLNTLITGDHPSGAAYGGIAGTSTGGSGGTGPKEAASATWALTANTSAATTGAVTATSQTYPTNMTAGYSSYTSTAGIYANETVQAQRIRPVNGWPANQTGPDAAQYVQYDIAPATNKILQLESLSFDFGDAGSTNTMKANIYYSMDNFATAGTLINPQPLTLPKYTTGGEFIRVKYEGLNLEVGTGKTLSVRVYPWWPSGASATKYLIERNIQMVGSTQSVLPLNLLLFSVKKALSQSNSIALNWTTANEVNTANFQIERSLDAEHFLPIGQLKAKNKAGQHNYSYYDDSQQAGQLYYRLKMIDQDGNFTYSKTMAIRVAPPSNVEVLIAPNPAREKITITLPAEAQLANLSVISAYGTTLLMQKAEAGAKQVVLDLKELVSGSYYLILQLKNERIVKQFVKL